MRWSIDQRMGAILSILDKAKRVLNERRARAAVDAATLVVRTMSSLPAAERSAVMIVAHAMLRDAAVDYGKDIVANPTKLPKTDLAEILARLGATHRKLSASLAAVADHVAGDVVYKGTLRQIRATEVVIVTVGMAWDKALLVPARQAWKAMWAARTHAVDGVRLIMAFQAAMHERALPESQAGGPEHMARLATTLPAMFRPKTPQPQAAAARAAGKPLVTGKSAARPGATPARKPAARQRSST
ncbi:hypothetical protein ACVIGB_000633 [Bradyrhizobium sp. USDA 4341]